MWLPDRVVYNLSITVGIMFPQGNLQGQTQAISKPQHQTGLYCAIKWRLSLLFFPLLFQIKKYILYNTDGFHDEKSLQTESVKQEARALWNMEQKAVDQRSDRSFAEILHSLILLP